MTRILRPAVRAWMHGALPAELCIRPDDLRRAQLMNGFAGMGLLFGTAFALFYLLISHPWGAGIVALCTILLGVTPLLLHRTRSLIFCGHYQSAIFTFGFAAMALAEGGIRGHAIAWLAGSPLIAMLLLGGRRARLWVAVAMLLSASFCAAEWMGFHPPFTYPAAWHGSITAAGMLSLVAFLATLGILFETGRERAQRTTEETLGQLARANRELRTLNAEKDEFLGMAAHDLRNPLSTVTMAAEIIKDQGGLDPDTLDLIGTVISEAGRMRDLVTTLLEVNQADADTLPPPLIPCDVTQLSAETVQAHRPSAEQKNQQIIRQETPPLWAQGDPLKLRQIFENLLSNAVKYSEPGRRIWVRSGVAENGFITWSVTDEGPGLTEEDRRNLFGRFARLSARPTGGEDSTGLGLSIVKRLIESMSGAITVQSEPGAGATFTIQLPATEPPRH